MALSLNAEQKEITKILSGKEQYIIPPYQRAYSWEQEQCESLWEDLKNAYLTNKEEGYFLGNIVIAKSREDKNRLEVIDGQQRLISITLLIKVLLYFNPDSNYLKEAIYIPGKKSNDIPETRLKTNVFEEKDSLFLKNVIETPLDKIYEFNDSKDNNFKKNILYFYSEIQKFSKANNIEDFSDFLLDNVSLLPIESEDTNQDNAREKALKIFETINNRGKELSNADIFKANLYSMALNNLEQDEFINRWKRLDSDCDNIGYDIERIFKIYSYQIRGQRGIKSSEIGLRDFFKKTDYTPFKHKKYNEIMDDLFDIVKAIEFFNTTKRTEGLNELPKWFQLIDIYTNNYPKDLIIVYLSNNINTNNFTDNAISFSRSLVRYCYFQGATTGIKQYIYDLTIKVMHNEWEEYYPNDLNERNYSFLGRLYKGFALLGAYLHPNQKSVYPYNLKRMRDIVDFWSSDYWNFDIVGNILATDLTPKELLEAEKQSKFEDINELRNDFKEWDNNKHLKRQEILKDRFIRFFRESDENKKNNNRKF